MTINSIFFCAFKRLHFALNSKMDNAGVSSINILASNKVFIFECNCCHSCASSFPRLILSASISASAEIILLTNWTADISSENKATECPKSTAAFRQAETTKAVFPIPGLAAIMINSCFCQPEVNRSKSVKPDGIPVRPLFCNCFFSNSSTAFFKISDILS